MKINKCKKCNCDCHCSTKEHSTYMEFVLVQTANVINQLLLIAMKIAKRANSWSAYFLYF